MSRLKYLAGLLILLAVMILPTISSTEMATAADIATNTFSDNNTALASVASPFIRDNFIGKGRHWIFYSDGTNIYFKSSTDGSTWSSATYVRAGTAGWNLNTYWDGSTYLYYVWGNATNNVALYWRRGAPASDGTITWDSEQVAVAAGALTNFFGHSVGVDSAGYCYIAYQVSPSGEKIYASKNANTDGTWSTEAGWPQQIGTGTAVQVSTTACIPLTSEKMAFVYTDSSASTMHLRTWVEATSTLSGEKTTVGSGRYYMSWSALAIRGEDDVHLVYAEKTSNDINHEIYDYSAGSFAATATIHAATLATTNPAIGIDSTNNHIFCFYYGHPDNDHVYYQEYDGANWGAAVEIIADEVDFSHYVLSCTYESFLYELGYIGVVWQKDAGSPYTCRYYGLDVAVAPTADTDAATLVEETTARLNGEMLTAGGVPITTRGFQYDTDSGAPYASDTHEHGTWWTGASAYSIDIASLTEGEAYYARAYVTNRVGTAYGPEVKFLTKPVEPNTFDVVFNTSTSLKMTWVAGAGTDNTIIRALENAYPAADRSDGTEVYNGALLTYTHGGLDNGDHWYYRAWSWCSEDGMSQWSDGYAQDNEIVTVTSKTETLAASAVTQTTATLNGEIQQTGGQNATIRGFEWDTNSGAPYANDWHEHGSFGVAAFNTGLIGLTHSTDYYFRAYSTNPAGTTYGAEFTFTTLSPPPGCIAKGTWLFTVGTDNIAMTWVKSLGSDNTIIVRNTWHYPVDMTDGVIVYNDNLTSFTDLGATNTAETEYYYSAWSWNTSGYSVCYTTKSTGGEAMSGSIMYLAMVGLLALIGGIFWKKKDAWPLMSIIIIAWIAFGIKGFTASAAMYDSDWWLGAIGIVMAIASGFLMWYFAMSSKEKPEVKEEPRLSDRMAARRQRWNNLRGR